MGKENKSTAGSIRLRGSLTVEAAVVFPMVLFCVCLMMKRGIALYSCTVQLINSSEIWRDFHPAEEFHRLELLEELF